ncbi:MAG TPA: tetratricopeptide repeat protein, partial [Pedobacter sp.]
MRKILVLLFCCASVLAYGQKDIRSTNTKAQKFYDQGRASLSYNLYDKALAEFTDAVKADPNFAAAYQQLGDLHRSQKRYQQAKINYQKVLQIDPGFHSRTIYGLADSELNTGDYINALQHFQKCISLPGITEESKKQIAKLIKDCEF